MKKIDFSKIALKIQSIQPVEKKISEYKLFYKKYLRNIKNREEALNDLSELKIIFQKLSPKLFLGINSNNIEADTIANQIIHKYFPDDINALFNKNIEVKDISKSSDYKYEDNGFLKNFGYGLLNNIIQTNEINQKELEYKINFINYLNDCLYQYGLHSFIQYRDVSIFKKYNLIIEHKFDSKTIEKEIKLLFDFKYLNDEILKPYQIRKPIKINGMLIPFNKIVRIKITTTLLLEDEIELFALKHNFLWTKKEKDEISFINLCKDETDELLKNPFILENENNIVFVNFDRIEELKKIKSNYDLKKLIRLCEELNSVSASNNSICSSVLFRAIIDHIPPIFNFPDFKQFANNYQGGTKSFKKAMMNLENSLRNIADNNIHSQIRQNEVLPNLIQVNYSQELDLLLSEIIRVLK